MTQDELDRLDALAAAATPGPWEADEDGMGRVWRGVDEPEYIASCKHDPPGDMPPGVDNGRRSAVDRDYEQRDTDAQFIAAAREAVPALVAEVKRLRGEAFHAEQALKMAEVEIGRLRGLVGAAFYEGYQNGRKDKECAFEPDAMLSVVRWCESETRRELNGTESPESGHLVAEDRA